MNRRKLGKKVERRQAKRGNKRKFGKEREKAEKPRK